MVSNWPNSFRIGCPIAPYPLAQLSKNSIIGTVSNPDPGFVTLAPIILPVFV